VTRWKAGGICKFKSLVTLNKISDLGAIFNGLGVVKARSKEVEKTTEAKGNNAPKQREKDGEFEALASEDLLLSQQKKQRLLTKQWRFYFGRDSAGGGNNRHRRNGCRAYDELYRQHSEPVRGQYDCCGPGIRQKYVNQQTKKLFGGL
jgi:hypothetical protein